MVTGCKSSQRGPACQPVNTWLYREAVTPMSLRYRGSHYKASRAQCRLCPGHTEMMVFPWRWLGVK